MSRPTNNYLVNKDKSRKHIDFIETIAEIGEPFQSTLLEKYPEYKHDISAYNNDEKECFLSILNKIGEDGCQVLTDRVVNYIDDVSNIDTTTPSALLSQAESIGYPYKDKKTVEQLSRLSKCSPLLQNLIWGVSTNAVNSKTILNRLNILEDLTADPISAIYDTDGLNREISGYYYNDISSKVFDRQYLYLDTSSLDTDVVSSDGAPALIDFSWMLYSIFADDIIKEYKLFDSFNKTVIDFGKYNRTIYSIVCHKYLYAQLYKLKSDTVPTKFTIENLNEMAKTFMPFLYDKKLFDPIQAAWSILYDTATISDFDSVYHDIINDFIKAFNEKLNDVSYNAVMQFIKDSNNPLQIPNSNFIYKLNANEFSYQQLLIRFIEDIRSLFGIEIKEYFDDYDNYMTKTLNAQNGKNQDGFYYLCKYSDEDSLLNQINFKKYITKIVDSIINLGKRIRTLREDLKLMTFRNSYKGTTALIQFSVIEYLKDCILDLTKQATDKYNFEHETSIEINKEVFDKILKAISSTDQHNIAVAEYWDYTEYFNRYYVDSEDIKIPNANSGSRVDWFNPNSENSDEWRVYGSMKENEILDFYTKVLNLSKDIYLEKNDSGIGYNQEGSSYEEKLSKLKTFLKAVYNSGVFTLRTNSNYEAIYSGDPEQTTNDSPWVAYKNQEFISKEVHPYIWNFTNKIANKLYQSNAVSTAVQNTEYELLIKHIHKLGNIVDQYRLSKNFVDSSGYVTRYEHRDHAKNERTQSYDGIIYPQFGYELTTKWHDKDEISANWVGDPISSGIKQRWYTDQVITLTKHGERKEISCLLDLYDNPEFLRSFHFDDGPKPSEITGVLGNYCIDRYETAYATDPHSHEFIYKENGYPFMRPLINGEKGMLFIDADDNIDTAFMNNPPIDNKIYDAFPRIVLSKDGTHLLLRINKNTIRSYTIGTHRNAYNETEKALILNYEINCDNTIFDDQFFNDALIKTIDDDFYILVPKYENNKFTNYLFYIKKNGKVCGLKQSIKEIPASNNIFRSGLFLNDGQRININTYYVNKSKPLPSDSEVSAVYSDEKLSTGNHQTPYKNWSISQSSFDVLNQFIQQHSSKEFIYTNMTDISVAYSNRVCPSVDLSIARLPTDLIDYSEVSVDNQNFLYGYLDNGNTPLDKSTKLPFIRMFNINSDAGFNPVYIGERGRIILENRRTSQLDLTKSTGGAFELLGPEVDFDTNVIIDSSTKKNVYDEIPNDNDRMFERIHEFYSKAAHGETFDDEEVEYAQSFDTVIDNPNEPRTSSYRYGYTSIVENNAYKNDTYRIKMITKAKFTDLHEATGELSYIKTGSQFRGLAAETGYSYGRIYIFLGVKNTLYSLVPRVPGTEIQTSGLKIKRTEFYKLRNAINDTKAPYSPYTIEFENNYIFDKIVFENRYASIYGKNIRELVNADIYLVYVVSKTRNIPTPNFMLPTEELRKALTNISVDRIDEHMRVPHTDSTGSYMTVTTAADLNDSEVYNVNNDPRITTGSLVFSITETDSEFMNNLLPDQRGKHDIKSVTVEAMNDFNRYMELAKTNVNFDTLDYDFIPWQIIDLNLKRKPDDTTDFGFDETENSVDKQYIIQPYEEINIQQDASNKYVISFWRKSENPTKVQNKAADIENVLPNKVKTTENIEPIYANEHQALGDLLKNEDFVPQLMVQWEYESDSNSPINLRFNNATLNDSPFINTEAGLEYKSLSTFTDSIMLKPGESGYIDVVAPNHILIGRTVFYNIPLMRALATNISDNKPKFMLTFLNDKSNDHLSLESNNYALVFMSADTPQLSNSDIVYTQCYVAPMLSSNQTIPPSVSNAVVLSELAFNFDVGNIINLKKYEDEDEDGKPIESLNNILIEKVNAITPNNKISQTVSTCIGFGSDSHQLRINEPIGETNEGFVTVDMKIDLKYLSKISLKNAMFTAHGTVIAYDNSEKPRLLPIVKVFGCSLDKIGTKRVLGQQNNVLAVTQNSGRETALQINQATFEQKVETNDSN